LNIYKAQPRLGISRRRGYLFYLKYAVALYKLCANKLVQILRADDIRPYSALFHYSLCGQMISASTVEKMDILKNFVPLSRHRHLCFHKVIGNSRIRAKSQLYFLRHHRAGKHSNNKLCHGHRPPDHIRAEGDGDNEYQRAADKYSARDGHEH